MLVELKLMATIEPWFPLRVLAIPLRLHRLRSTTLFMVKLVTPRLPLPASPESGMVELAELDPGAAWCAAIPLLWALLHELDEELEWECGLQDDFELEFEELQDEFEWE